MAIYGHRFFIYSTNYWRLELHSRFRVSPDIADELSARGQIVNWQMNRFLEL
jgi:hypothetical protein